MNTDDGLLTTSLRGIFGFDFISRIVISVEISIVILISISALESGLKLYWMCFVGKDWNEIVPFSIL